MPLDPAKLRLKKHKIGKAFVEYHNRQFRRGRSTGFLDI